MTKALPWARAALPMALAFSFAAQGAETPGLGMHGLQTGFELGLAGALGNPAGTAVLVPKDGNSRLAFQLVGVNAEVGPVDDFLEEIEDLEDDLDQENMTPEEADAIIARINPLLVEMGQSAYANIGLNLFSFVSLQRAWGGTLSWSLTPERLNKITVLDAPVEYDDANEELVTDTAVLLRTATSYRFGLSYAADLKDATWLPSGDRWYWGGRLKLSYAKLDRIASPLMDDDEESGTEATDDAEYSLGRGQGSFGIGVDAGAMYRHDWFHTGLTIHNLIPATHDFQTISTNCAAVSDSLDRDTCEVAANFPSRLSRTDSYREKPKLNGEFVFRAPDSNWSVGTSLDLTAGENVFGDEQQWFALSGGYSPQRFWIPGFSLGYRKNLAGSELSNIGIGLNLFGFLRIDASKATDDVKVDGDTYPRDLSVSLSFQSPL